MRKSLLWCMALAVVAGPALAQAGGPGGMGSQRNGSASDAFPLGNRGPIVRPHVMKPISKEKYDKVVVAMFDLADVKHTGMVTLADLQAVIVARREAVIRAHFGEIDTNKDGNIGITEFIAWQARLGSAAGSPCAGYGNQDQIVSESLLPPLATDEQDDAIGQVLEPLGAVMITRANVHYRPGLMLDDLVAYENARFAAADTDHDGFLDQDEVAAFAAAARKPAGQR